MDVLVHFFERIPLDLILIQTVNGIVTGMILALIASGLTLIFGIMDVVNFAHGELFMLGAYVGVVIISTTGSFWLALIGAALIVALLGAAMQIVALRPLIGRDPLNTILPPLRLSVVFEDLGWVDRRTGGAQDRGADHRPIHTVLSTIPLVPPFDRGAVGRHYRRLLAVPQTRKIWRVDQSHRAGPR